MAWVDACCLQFTVKNKDGREKETFTFQTNNPVIKKDWIVGKDKSLSGFNPILANAKYKYCKVNFMLCSDLMSKIQLYM